ncbi:MAG: hypothetical protein IJV77_07835 [Clostridia bacterium]|nr:hypothetical protein [Clostridia bacterium]
MLEMICALVMTRKLASIIMLATAAAIMALIVFCGPKNKSNAEYNADLDQADDVEEVEESAEEVAEEPVAEEPVQEVEEEVAEEVAEEVEQPIEEQPVEEVVEEQPAEQPEVVEEEVVEEPEVVEEQPAEEIAEESVVEEVAEEAEVVEEATPVTLEEPIVDEPQQPACADPVDEQPAEEVVATVAKNKLNIPVGKKRTFAEKMTEADEENQAIYNMLKNELMSYKKVSNRLTKVIDIFKHKGTYLAKVGLTGKTVKLHLALDPNEYAVTKYHHKDLGEKKKYEFVPLALKVKSPRSQKYALELIAGVMEKAGIAKNPKYEQKDYVAAMKEAQAPKAE